MRWAEKLTAVVLGRSAVAGRDELRQARGACEKLIGGLSGNQAGEHRGKERIPGAYRISYRNRSRVSPMPCAVKKQAGASFPAGHTNPAAGRHFREPAGLALQVSTRCARNQCVKLVFV